MEEVSKIVKNNQPSLFDLDEYSDRRVGDYDWENSELDRMYEQPPPKQRPPLGGAQASQPDDTRSILKICEWMRAQPNGHNLDLPDRVASDLLPILEPPILREHFKNLLPIPENREQNREHKSWLSTNFPVGELVDNQPLPAGTGIRGQPHILLPIPENREQNREQIGTDPTRSHLVPTDNDRRIVKVNGITYLFKPTKSLKPIHQLNGWLDVKPSSNKQNLYLFVRWRDGTIQRSRYLGKVIKQAIDLSLV